jgi:ClpP class serine protease
MAYEQRIELYKKLEEHRGHPLIVYVTSDRQNSSGQISGDSVRELLTQLHAVPENISSLDLLVVSQGGDPTVAWRIVSLIREQVTSFNVLIPQAAYSAATLIALGADEIVMHPHGNLGPTDPQISGPRLDGSGTINFGSEDLGAFLKFAKEEVGWVLPRFHGRLS